MDLHNKLDNQMRQRKCTLNRTSILSFIRRRLIKKRVYEDLFKNQIGYWSIQKKNTHKSVKFTRA